jgi:hypothetical protein
MLRCALQQQDGAIIDDLNIRVFRAKAGPPIVMQKSSEESASLKTASKILLKKPLSNYSGDLDWPTDNQRLSKSEAPHAYG